MELIKNTIIGMLAILFAILKSLMIGAFFISHIIVVVILISFVIGAYASIPFWYWIAPLVILVGYGYLIGNDKL